MAFKLFALSAFAATARDIGFIASTPKAPPLIAGHPSSLELREAHIDPSWIIAGNPQARLAGFIRPPLDPAQIAADLQLLVEAK